MVLVELVVHKLLMAHIMMERMAMVEFGVMVVVTLCVDGVLVLHVVVFVALVTVVGFVHVLVVGPVLVELRTVAQIVVVRVHIFHLDIGSVAVVRNSVALVVRVRIEVDGRLLVPVHLRDDVMLLDLMSKVGGVAVPSLLVGIGKAMVEEVDPLFGVDSHALTVAGHKVSVELP